MINLKVLSTSPHWPWFCRWRTPTASFAQNHGRGGGGARWAAAPARWWHAHGGHAHRRPTVPAGGGGGAFMARVGGPARFSGGGYRGTDMVGGGVGFFPGAVAGAVIGGALASGPRVIAARDITRRGYYDDG